MKYIKKLFGEVNMTWPKVIIFAVVTAIYTALINQVPFFKYTSFRDIAISFECWILFAIIIIVNSKSGLDSALKTFVFFLISQPLIYLIEVPFLGLNIFSTILKLSFPDNLIIPIPLFPADVEIAQIVSSIIFS